MVKLSVRYHIFAALLLVAGLSACSDGSDNLPMTEPAFRPDAPGPFGVGHAAFTPIDPVRGNRMLPVDVWYPTDEADFPDAPVTIYPLAAGIGLESQLAREDAPISASTGLQLVVFSHGYGGIATASVGLMETLASHGFVVISPEHSGNSQSDNSDSFDQAAANRVPDVSFLIDTMLARSDTPGDRFFGKLDPERVGVVGHSFGGMTALGMKAGWAGAEPDERVAAIVPISAVIQADLQSDFRSGPNAGFTAEQLARIAVPTMLIGGTEDVDVFIENNEIAFRQVINAPRAYKTDIIGANHTHFANVCDIGNLLIDLGINQDSWELIGAGDLLEPYATTCSPEAFSIEEAVRLQNLYVTCLLYTSDAADDASSV